MESAADVLKKGGVCVIPTDTVYGIVASALDRAAVERVYGIKGRDENKPFIVLVPSLGDLERFGAVVDGTVRDFLMENWPAPLSIILPVSGDDFAYIHRGAGSIAFRMPDDPGLERLLAETGPLVAPSANPQGEPPAANVSEARRYFGDSVDLYVDGGDLESEPSTVVRWDGAKLELVREGGFKFEMSGE